MDDKRAKFVGRPVSKEEVIAHLGVPSAEWERNARRLKFRDHLRPGAADLDISGIRGYCGRDGYLGYLEKSLLHPLGVGTGLVSDEEDERILRQIIAEVRPEIEKYRARLAELERSPEAVSAFVTHMRWWLGHLRKVEMPDPALEPLEELAELTRQCNAEHLQQIEIIEREITTYDALLTKLRDDAPTS